MLGENWSGKQVSGSCCLSISVHESANGRETTTAPLIFIGPGQCQVPSHCQIHQLELQQRQHRHLTTWGRPPFVVSTLAPQRLQQQHVKGGRRIFSLKFAFQVLCQRKCVMERSICLDLFKSNKQKVVALKTLFVLVAANNHTNLVMPLESF